MLYAGLGVAEGVQAPNFFGNPPTGGSSFSGKIWHAIVTFVQQQHDVGHTCCLFDSLDDLYVDIFCSCYLR